MNKILLKKLKEALIAVLPITAIILVINFCVPGSMSGYTLLSFGIGVVLLILGMGLYSLGSDVAIEPIGGHIGSRMTQSKNLPLILGLGFVIGLIVTIAEPDLTVLAEQVSGINNWVLILTVAVGVGLFLLLAILRITVKIPLSYVLLVLYAAVFVLGLFVSENFIPLAFDSGGVTTGPITVPFIIALGVGVSAVLGGRNSQDNSFGLIGICSIGPILAVMLLGIVFRDKLDTDYQTEVTALTGVGAVFWNYLIHFPVYLREVGIALAPIVAFFLIFQFAVLKLPKKALLRIVIGIVYTYVGLTVFLTGVNVGFLPAGHFIGQALADVNRWVLIPVGMLVGAFIVLAEPAVHVLNKQVEEITGGLVKRRTMLLVLALSMAVSIGLSMLRVCTGISIWFVILPGYAVALLLSFFVPKIFTAIAFDSGGVASGPMTATFLLPMAVGAVAELGGNVLTDAFGIVATVAMTPLVALQILGLVFQVRTHVKARAASVEAARLLAEEGQIIDFTLPVTEEVIQAPAPAAAKKRSGRRKQA